VPDPTPRLTREQIIAAHYDISVESVMALMEETRAMLAHNMHADAILALVAPLEAAVVTLREEIAALCLPRDDLRAALATAERVAVTEYEVRQLQAIVKSHHDHCPICSTSLDRECAGLNAMCLLVERKDGEHESALAAWAMTRGKL
jgi:hypothetical protein